MKMKTCRICLATDVKLSILGDTEEKIFIENIFKQNGYSLNLMSQHYACYECRAHLGKTIKFIHRALKAQKVLNDILKEKNKVTQHFLQGLDRHKLGLNTNLEKQICFNFHINEEKCDDSWADISNNAKVYIDRNLIGANIKLKEKINAVKIYNEVYLDPCASSSVQQNASSHYQSFTVKPSVAEGQCKRYTINENKYVSLNFKTQDENNTDNYDISLIEAKDKLDERECYIEIKSEQYSDPLVGAPTTADEICLNTTKYKIIAHEPKSNIPADSYSCSVKTNEMCTEIKIENVDQVLETNYAFDGFTVRMPGSSCCRAENQEQFLGNVKNNDDNKPDENKDSIFEAISTATGTFGSVSDRIAAYKLKSNLLLNNLFTNEINEKKVKNKCRPRKVIKRIKKTPPEKQKTYTKKVNATKKQNLNIKSVKDEVEDDVDKTARRKEAKYVFSDHSDGPSEVSYEKIKQNEEEDNEYQPTSSGHSEDSMYDRYDDDGRRMKKPVKREYPRKCDHCNFEVPIRKEHFIHYVRFHKDIEYPYANKPIYVCQFCGKKSTMYQHHRDHELSHGEKTVKCTKCSKMFTSATRMQSHSRVVHCTKPFICDYCGKTCKARGDLRLHIRIHTGEKPYKCHICGAGFAHCGNRTIHVRTNHQQSIVYPKNKKPKNRKYQYTSSNTDTSGDEYNIKKKRKTIKTKRKQKEQQPTSV